MAWDYIIIGAGSAGCALANRLVSAGSKVLVLEAGGSDSSPFIRVAAGQRRACADHDWGYRSQPDPTRNGLVENWTRGRVLGGSSSINGTMFVRGTAADFDRWNVPGWSASDVMPIFKEFETSDQQGNLRGSSGPLHVRTVKQPHAITEAFVDSAVAAGYPANPDYNGTNQEGVGYAQLSQRRGFRCSAADAFLKPLLGSSNLKLLLDAFVEKIEIDNGRAVAVHFIHKGIRCRETARDIVVCAGTVNSPKLLMLSGIGPAEGLRSHGIQPIIDLAGVGQNLKEQPLISLSYRSRVATYNPTEGLLQKLGIAAKFLKSGEGPISNLFEGAAFLKSTASEPVPDIQVIFLAFSFAKVAEGRYELAPYPGVLALIMKSYPLSSGRITLASADPAAPPVIECPLLQKPDDVRTLVEGIRTVRRIMNTQPIAALLEEEITPGPRFSDTSGLEDFIRNNASLSYHPIGTCRMGVDPGAVVGPELRVRGTDNLWVADASIIPDHLSANLNAPSMMIGSKLGLELANRH